MEASYDLETLKSLLESDLSTLYKLVNTFGVPVTEGDIRAASSILRRWFHEGLIGQLCRLMDARPTFPVLDNSEALSLISQDENVNYFLTAGVMLNGTPVMFIYNSSSNDVVPLKEGAQILVKTGDFLSQKRVYFEGSHFTTGEIIAFTANKLGGVHFDARRNEVQFKMQQASEYMTFGGPPEKIGREPPGELYMAIEPDSREIMSGFHLEIIAASASFIQLHLNDQPLAQLPRTRKKLWNRLFGDKKHKFKMFGRKRE